METSTDRSPSQARTIKRMIVFILAMAVLVFGVTFVTQFLGNKGSGTTEDVVPTAESQVAVDDVTAWDLDQPTMPREFEWNQPGYFCFWIANTKNPAEPVSMGLLGKNCTCTKVEVATAPDGVVSLSARERRARAEDPRIQWKTLEKTESPEAMDKKGVTIPAGGGGWVRLNWEGPQRPAGAGGSQSEDRTFKASFWTRKGRKDGYVLELKVNALYVDPVHVVIPDALSENKLDNVADVGQKSAEEPITVTYVTYSSTRDYKLAPPSPNESRIRWDPPVPLTDEDKKLILDKRHLKAGYRITGHLQPQHVGLFRRTVVISKEPVEDPVTGVVKGNILGDARVITGDDLELGGVQLGKFPAHEGIKKEVHIEGKYPSVSLKLDKYPDFMEVEPPRRVDDGSGISWVLMLRVLPGKKDGFFGDARDPQDCAIYLQVLRPEKPPQVIRIPVLGEGTQSK